MHRFGVLNDIYLELQAQGFTDIQFIGINGYQYIYDNYSQMVAGNVLPWVQDIPEFDVWHEWDVTLRDLVILDREGNYITRMNLTTYNPDPDLACPGNYEALWNLLTSLQER